jgi:Domain of unknown function (DUF4902)
LIVKAKNFERAEGLLDNGPPSSGAKDLAVVRGAIQRRGTLNEPPRLAVSADGYVRLTLATFHTIRLVHLLSELDPDDVAHSASPTGASAATVVGFTEWVSETFPALSVGWNWCLVTGNTTPRYERVGEVRSNIMLVDANGRDYGAVGTDVLLRDVIDALGWQDQVSHYITQRYA